MIAGKKSSRDNGEDPCAHKENRSEMHYVTQLIEALEKSDDALLVSLEKRCQFVNCLGAVKEGAVAIVTASLEESPLKTAIKTAMRDITQENIPAIVDCLSESGNDELLVFYLYFLRSHYLQKMCYMRLISQKENVTHKLFYFPI